MNCFGILQNNAKNPGGNRFSVGGRRVDRPAAPGRRYNSYFYILQAPAEYKNDLGISGCGGPPTSVSWCVLRQTVPLVSSVLCSYLGAPLVLAPFFFGAPLVFNSQNQPAIPGPRGQGQAAIKKNPRAGARTHRPVRRVPTPARLVRCRVHAHTSTKPH